MFRKKCQYIHNSIIIGQVVHFKYKSRNIFPVVKVFLDHYNKYLILSKVQKNAKTNYSRFVVFSVTLLKSFTQQGFRR